MKALTLIFVVLIALLQYPLWLGKGSWLRVWDLSHQIAKQQEKNNALKARNDTLDAEVRDLKSGRSAIEERARSELGMVKQDEVFYQVLEGPMPVVEPPPTLPKIDAPIIVPVPGKTDNPNTAQDNKAKPKSAKPSEVKPANEAKPKDSKPKDAGLANGLKDKAAQEKSAPAVSPLTQEPAAVKPTEEKPKSEKPKAEEKAKKPKLEGDALDDARAVLKQ